MKEKQNSALYVKISTRLLNLIKLRASIYSNGDVSKWVRHCLEDPKRKYLKGDQLRPPKKK